MTHFVFMLHLMDELWNNKNKKRLKKNNVLIHLMSALAAWLQSFIRVMRLLHNIMNCIAQQTVQRGDESQTADLSQTKCWVLAGSASTPGCCKTQDKVRLKLWQRILRRIVLCWWASCFCSSLPPLSLRLHPLAVSPPLCDFLLWLDLMGRGSVCQRFWRMELSAGGT